jgi:hypothetical protein
MTTILSSARDVKSDRPFARGIAHRRFIPSQADQDWAAQFFGELEDARLRDEEDRRLEEQAQQAAWDDQFRFPAGICESCGKPSDWFDPTHKLCGECLTAAENATIACQNRNAMGQYRVF